MKLLRITTLGLLSSTLSVAWLFLSALVSWDYYSSGWQHYLALTVAFPWAIAAHTQTTIESQFLIATIITFASATLLVLVLNRALQTMFHDGA
jgi:hypothetical protein